MELPTGIIISGKDNESRVYILKLKKSLYGLKQASLNWFEKLKQGLMDQGFTSSEIDPCLYLKENIVLLTYVDDCIIISPSRESIDRLISSMQSGPENFKLTDEGGVNKLLGVEITHLNDNSFELSQPFLIDRILSFLGLCKNEFETDTNSTSMPVTMASCVSICGNIARLWSCFLIYKTLAAQKFLWQCIRQLVFPTILCSLTRNP